MHAAIQLCKICSTTWSHLIDMRARFRFADSCRGCRQFHSLLMIFRLSANHVCLKNIPSRIHFSHERAEDHVKDVSWPSISQGPLKRRGENRVSSNRTLSL